MQQKSTSFHLLPVILFLTSLRCNLHRVIKISIQNHFGSGDFNLKSFHCSLLAKEELYLFKE